MGTRAFSVCSGKQTRQDHYLAVGGTVIGASDQPPSATLLYGVTFLQPAVTPRSHSKSRPMTLSDGMKELLEPLYGVHSARRSYEPSGTFGQRDDRRSMEIIGDECL